MLILKFIFFIFLSVSAFTIPGLILFKILRIKYPVWEKITLSTVVGFTLYTLLTYLFHLINLPILSIFFILFASLYFLKTHKQILPRVSTKIKNKDLIIIIVCLIGIAGQLAVIAPSGMLNKKGDMYFYSSHGHDGSWHVALMNEIQNGFPIKNPDYSGERLVNYHFLSDIAPADFNQFFRLSSLDLYFRYFPFLYSVLLGSLAFYLGKTLSKSFWGGVGAASFTLFAGSFGYIVTWLKEKTIGGESIFWSSQIQSSSGNPPQIISNFIFLADLIFIYNYFKKPQKNHLPIIIILTGILSLTKIYALIVILPALLIVSLIRLMREKKCDMLLTSVIAVTFSLLLYLPNTSGSESFLIFQPWWFIRTLIVEPSRLNLINWELKRQTYLAEKNLPRVLQIEIYGLIMFIFGNIGTRSLGFYWFYNNRKKIFKNYFYQILVISITISFTFPLLFLQKGVAGNTIQTFQYFLLIMGVLAGISVYQILIKIHSISIRRLILIVIIVLSIPTQVSLLYQFYSNPPVTKITKAELRALNFLKNKSSKDSVILTPPYDQYSKFKSETTPHIWAWYNTSYVPAFSKRTEFFTDYEQMDIMGYNIQKRQKIQKQIFFEQDTKKVKNMITKNKINYLYFPKKIRPVIKLSKIPLEKIFENEDVEIWKLEN